MSVICNKEAHREMLERMAFEQTKPSHLRDPSARREWEFSCAKCGKFDCEYKKAGSK